MRNGFFVKHAFFIAGYFFGTSLISSPAPWYNSNWAFRHVITIRGSSVFGTLTNYPVLINISNNGFLFSNSRPDGADILFTGASGTNLSDFEIESYSNGMLYAWVRYPLLTNGIHAKMFIYYGNPDQTNSLSVKTNVWDNDYQIVAHCHQESVNLSDSTANNFTGTTAGTGTPIYGKTDLIGRCIQTSLTAYNYWTFSSNVLTNTNFHIEYWWRPEPISNSTAQLSMLYKGTSWATTGVYIFRYLGGGQTYYRWADPPAALREVNFIPSDRYRPHDNNCVYYFSAEANSGLFTIWVNGWLPKVPTSGVTISPNTTEYLKFGSIDNNAVGRGLSIDELRISFKPRGSNYTATVYTNLAHPNNFIWISNVEALLKTRFTVSTTNIFLHPTFGGKAIYSNSTPQIVCNITNAKFIFADGTIITRSGAGTSFQPVEHSFAELGTFTNWLITSDELASVGSNFLVVQVVPYPYATATFQVDPCEALLGSRMYFSDTSIKPCAITNWEIDFGNGKSYTIRTDVGRREISYVYPCAGTYVASLRVVDERGVSNTNTYKFELTVTDRGAMQLTNITRRIYNRAIDFPLDFKYYLSEKAEKVYVRILSITGYMIRDLGVFNGFTDTEVFISWDGDNWKGQDVASGLYYIRFDVIGEGERIFSKTDFFFLK